MSPKLPQRTDRADWLMQVAFTTVRLFMRNGLQNHAAATAFYFMLSATPLLLLLAYGTQWLAKLAETSNLATIMFAALYERKVNPVELLGFVGLSEKASEQVQNLSGGQKQRILISRAIADHPEILILDDSSSALDYKTDAQLRKEISMKLKDTTTIIIAQRASSVMNCDRIIVIEDGKVIGTGIG